MYPALYLLAAGRRFQEAQPEEQQNNNFFGLIRA